MPACLLVIAACASTSTRTDSHIAASATERESASTPRTAKATFAKAALTPVTGSKLEPTLISFAQREKVNASVKADAFDGVKPGTYWLIIHDGTTCGPNATKAGPVWRGMDKAMRVEIREDLTGGLDETDFALTLDGDAGAIGRVLVLHADKKGKPGKALACGVIEEVDEP